MNELRTLHDFEIAPNGGAFAGVNHTTEENSVGSKVDLLEATPTRVRVRQDALFEEQGAGTNILGGIKGIGDYSVYGTGRTAVRWTETDRNTPAFVYARRQIGMTAHYTAGAPLNNYTPCFEGNGACNSSGGGGAAADWLLGVRDVRGRQDGLPDHPVAGLGTGDHGRVLLQHRGGCGVLRPGLAARRGGQRRQPDLEPAHLLQAHELQRGGGPAGCRRDLPQHGLPRAGRAVGDRGRPVDGRARRTPAGATTSTSRRRRTC